LIFPPTPLLPEDFPGYYDDRYNKLVAEIDNTTDLKMLKNVMREVEKHDELAGTRLFVALYAFPKKVTQIDLRLPRLFFLNLKEHNSALVHTNAAFVLSNDPLPNISKTKETRATAIRVGGRPFFLVTTEQEVYPVHASDLIFDMEEHIIDHAMTPDEYKFPTESLL
jgi:hypothetical protein